MELMQPLQDNGDDMSQHDIEQAAYDQLWGAENSTYGGGHPGYTENFLLLMKRWVEKRPLSSRNALEIGCGDGYFSSQLIKLKCDVTGIDLSPVGVEQARRRAPTGRFFVHDLTVQLPLEENTFDVVWCSEVLEHLFSPMFVLTQIHKVLKPGGVLIATVPYHGLIKNLAIALFAFERHYDPEYPHVRFFTAKSLKHLVQKTGLAIREVSTCGSGLGIRDVIFPTNLLMAAEKLP
jgi:2-polyprenyl-3-methyl-5-hydroxy-6-metoxy-1,4-benzoquinol methylase